MIKRSDRRGVFVASTMAVVSLAASVWTATVESIPRGYIVACVVLSLIAVLFAWWRPRFTAPVAVVVASFAFSVLRREFYGQPPMLSARSLQSFAIWAFTFAAAALLRFALSLRSTNSRVP